MKSIKKVSFCCPQHGLLRGSVNYISVVFGSRTFTDIPIVYCKECKKYYTPYANLLAFVNLQYRGIPIVATESHVEKSFPKVETRIPHFVDTKNTQKPQRENSGNPNEHKKQGVVNSSSLRRVDHCNLILTNKPCFTKEYLCPCCDSPTKTEQVKIFKSWKILTAKIRHCDLCDADYITPRQFNSYIERIQRRSREQTDDPFIQPRNIKCEYVSDNRYLFIPRWMIYSPEYDWNNLPPRKDMYYDVTDEEYSWIKKYFEPNLSFIDLRQQSFLGASGYSANESEIRRHSILKKCVHEYGKAKVIRQLKSNINLRSGQRNKNYGKAINTWRGDIWYVEHEL